MNAQAVNLEFFALNKAIKQTNWLHVLSPALISFMISGGPCATSPFQFPIKSPVSVAELTRILYNVLYTCTHGLLFQRTFFAPSDADCGYTYKGSFCSWSKMLFRTWCAEGCWIKDESKKCLKGSGERKVSWWGGSVGRPFPILGALIVETGVCL